jgi:alkaline phosphatase
MMRALGAIALFVWAAMTAASDEPGPADEPLAADAGETPEVPKLPNVAAVPEVPKARNVILFVGDGMGVATVTAARILEGQLRGQTGEENLLSFERFPYTALSKTYNVDMQVPDSAGTMTAMMSGIKTRAGLIGVSPAIERGDCAGADDASVPTLLEQAEQRGLVTGIVSTARITHATPAATYAHAADRNWEADTSTLPMARELGCVDIAAQLVEFNHGDGIEVVLGGGRAAFMPSSALDSEGTTGYRADGRDLIAEWQARYPKGRYVWNTESFDAAVAARAPQLFGLFEASHMEYEADRTTDVGEEPSLAQMTEAAIGLLSERGEGYFLMVEAGRIDHGHHAGNAYRALTDTIALSEAVAVAARLTDESDTLIIVTADHSHTLTMSGYPARGNPILGKVRFPNGEYARDANGLPYTTLGYANGPGALPASDNQPAGVKRYPHFPRTFDDEFPTRPDLTSVDTTDPLFLQEALVPLGTETHAGEDVPVYARGPGASRVHGVIEQDRIYHLMRAAFAWKEE